MVRTLRTFFQPAICPLRWPGWAVVGYSEVEDVQRGFLVGESPRRVVTAQKRALSDSIPFVVRGRR